MQSCCDASPSLLSESTSYAGSHHFLREQVKNTCLNTPEHVYYQLSQDIYICVVMQCNSCIRPPFNIILHGLLTHFWWAVVKRREPLYRPSLTHVIAIMGFIHYEVHTLKLASFLQLSQFTTSELIFFSIYRHLHVASLGTTDKLTQQFYFIDIIGSLTLFIHDNDIIIYSLTSLYWQLAESTAQQ